jgi:hypothetical protein
MLATFLTPVALVVVVILLGFAIYGSIRPSPTQKTQDAEARARRDARKRARADRKASKG